MKLSPCQLAALRFLGVSSYAYSHSWVSIVCAVKLQLPNSSPRFGTVRALVDAGLAVRRPKDGLFHITPNGWDLLREVGR